MKKLLVIAALCLVGCRGNVDTSPKSDSTVIVDGTITIEGCEYLQFQTYYGYLGITHKGNCTNPIHQPDTLK